MTDITDEEIAATTPERAAAACTWILKNAYREFLRISPVRRAYIKLSERAKDPS